MKKPNGLEALLKVIVSWVGVAFVCAGILTCLGVLQPKPNSQIQDPVVVSGVFLLVGVTFAFAAMILGRIAVKKNRQTAELLAKGMKIKAVVEKVELLRSVQYGNRSPYRIRYTYTHLGRTYHHKSHFLWEKPDLASGDPILICADDFGKSTIAEPIGKA